MPGPDASGVDGGGVGIGRSAGMTPAGPVVELDDEPPLVGAVEVRSGMKLLPSVGGLGGGAARGAGGGGAEGRSDEVGFGAETGGGGGVEVGIGAETDSGGGAEGDPDGASDIEGEGGCFAGGGEDAFMKVGGGNGAGRLFGVSVCFTGGGVELGQGLLLDWVSSGFRGFMFVGCGGGDGGKLGPDREAAVVGLPDPDGVCDEPLPERVDAGAGGLGCGPSGFFGGSVPLAGRMIFVFLGCGLFTSGNGDNGGGVEFVPIGEGFAFWFVLSPADPAAGLPQSLAPLIGGAVAFGNSTAAGRGGLPPGVSSCSKSVRFMPDGGRVTPSPVGEFDFPGSDSFSLVGCAGFTVGAGGGRFNFVVGDVGDPDEGERGVAGTGDGVALAAFFSGSSDEDGSIFWGAGGISPGSEMATLGEAGKTRSRILSPITAPVMHRNVQVIEIPILCSSFMRLLHLFR